MLTSRARARRATAPRIHPRIISAPRSGQCRICSCADWRACENGCSWVDRLHTLCSACGIFADFTREEAIAILRAAGFLGRTTRVTRNAIETAVARMTDVLDSFALAGGQVQIRKKRLTKASARA